MLSDNNSDKLKDYLLQLGYTELDISEIVSAYTALIPVLANISKRIFKEKHNV